MVYTHDQMPDILRHVREDQVNDLVSAVLPSGRLIYLTPWDKVDPIIKQYRLMHELPPFYY